VLIFQNANIVNKRIQSIKKYGYEKLEKHYIIEK